jgi:hypothetical protein
MTATWRQWIVLLAVAVPCGIGVVCIERSAGVRAPWWFMILLGAGLYEAVVRTATDDRLRAAWCALFHWRSAQLAPWFHQMRVVCGKCGRVWWEED